MDEESGRQSGNKADNKIRGIITATAGVSRPSSSNRGGALARRISSLEDALGKLRWDQDRAERGDMRMEQERHGPSRWCWHVLLEAGTLLLGLESLICKDKKRHEEGPTLGSQKSIRQRMQGCLG